MLQQGHGQRVGFTALWEKLVNEDRPQPLLVPLAYALKELTAADEARIAALVRKAAD